MEFKDYYAVLGVERGATAEDVKRAYRRLARKYHPDVSKESDAKQRFQELGEAYEVLKDPEKRAAYDNVGRGFNAGDDFSPPPGWQGGVHFREGADIDASDFFDALFGAGRGGRSAGAGFRSSRRARGGDEHARVQVTVEEAVAGSERNLRLAERVFDQQGHLVERSRDLRVRIPPGVSGGQNVRVPGQGGAGIGDGERGDLYLEVEIATHPVYRVEGNDLYLNLPVAPWEAALGATVQVPTPRGRVELKVPAGSQSGRRLRLRERGLGARHRGDLHAVVQIVTPPADTDAARSFYQRMAEELAFDPRAHMVEG